MRSANSSLSPKQFRCQLQKLIQGNGRLTSIIKTYGTTKSRMFALTTNTPPRADQAAVASANEKKHPSWMGKSPRGPVMNRRPHNWNTRWSPAMLLNTEHRSHRSQRLHTIGSSPHVVAIVVLPVPLRKVFLQTRNDGDTTHTITSPNTRTLNCTSCGLRSTYTMTANNAHRSRSLQRQVLSNTPRPFSNKHHSA